jgi:hypothetical protein
MKKYYIPVSIETTASTSIGGVECDSIEEFQEEAEKLWEDQGWGAPSTNCHNGFDLNDWEISKVSEEELKYYENK